jgi:hypothetical protein
MSSTSTRRIVIASANATAPAPAIRPDGISAP